MTILLLLLVLVVNFGISWANTSYVGRYWSESKEVGGSFRAYIIAGYIMAIAGFTMVYGYILLLISPIFLQLAEVDADTILMFEQLSSDLIYLFCVATIVPTGFYIWIRSLKNFWEEKTLANGLRAGWNSFAQIHNTVSVARNAPSALGRVAEALFGGYFTASSIMKKADREYDMFSDLKEKHPEAF